MAARMKTSRALVALVLLSPFVASAQQFNMSGYGGYNGGQQQQYYPQQQYGQQQQYGYGQQQQYGQQAQMYGQQQQGIGFPAQQMQGYPQQQQQYTNYQPQNVPQGNQAQRRGTGEYDDATGMVICPPGYNGQGDRNANTNVATVNGNAVIMTPDGKHR